MKPSAEELFGPAGTPRVVVVGAGFGGIAAGVKMKNAGIHTFTIYESSLGIGGTWWDNTYPGAEVDVGSHLYSFSFKPHDWTRTHAKQAELQKYLEETVDEFGLRPHLRLGVSRGVGDVGRRPPRLDRHARRRHHRRVPRVHQRGRVPQRAPLPRLAGPRRLRAARSSTRRGGSTTTTSRDKVVAVVGTGSTATQIVPAIQPEVKHLYVFQREPGWVMPKGDRDFTDDERRPVLEPVAAPAGAPAAAVAAREEHLGRQDLRGRHEEERGAHAVLPRLHRAELRGPARPAGSRHAAATRTRGSGRSSRPRSIPRSRSPTSSSSPRPWRR